MLIGIAMRFVKPILVVLGITVGPVIIAILFLLGLVFILSIYDDGRVTINKSAISADHAYRVLLKERHGGFAEDSQFTVVLAPAAASGDGNVIAIGDEIDDIAWTGRHTITVYGRNVMISAPAWHGIRVAWRQR